MGEFTTEKGPGHPLGERRPQTWGTKWQQGTRGQTGPGQAGDCAWEAWPRGDLDG